MELKAYLVKFSIFSKVSNVTSIAWGASNPPQAIEVNLKKWTHMVLQPLVTGFKGSSALSLLEGHVLDDFQQSPSFHLVLLLKEALV
jgi:hypothetical protein